MLLKKDFVSEAFQAGARSFIEGAVAHCGERRGPLQETFAFLSMVSHLANG